MKKDMVRRAFERFQTAKAKHIEAETEWFLIAYKYLTFHRFTDATKAAKDASNEWIGMLDQLSEKQQADIAHEFDPKCLQFVTTPRKRPDMTHDQLIEACRRRKFHLYDKGIGIRPNFVVERAVRWKDGKLHIDRRESLKRAIEWAAK